MCYRRDRENIEPRQPERFGTQRDLRNFFATFAKSLASFAVQDFQDFDRKGRQEFREGRKGLAAGTLKNFDLSGVILRDLSPEGSSAQRHGLSQSAYPLRARCFASSA
jgi:hypothetical protein